MHSLRNNGDTLAQEFSRILGTNVQPAIEKKASLESNLDEAEVSDADSDIENSVEDAIADMLIEPEGDSAGMVSDAIDNHVKDLDAYAHLGAKQSKIMNGLNKIASGLRLKNESFAADVVEATALSILDDINKEANKKSFVIGELKKIAKSLDNSGEELCADMVRVTMSRIKNN